MDCIIRVIKGSDAGLTHRLGPGQTTIGRAGSAALRLTALDVSWEHAAITRNGDDYLLENLSASGTYVGDAKVAGQIRLRPRDEIRLSRDTVLRFEPVSGQGMMDSRVLLGALLGIMVLVLVGLVYLGIGKGSREDDWDGAYNVIEPWLRNEAEHGRLPPAAVDLFHLGWRLEQINDYEKSRFAWLRLQLLLDHLETRRRFSELAKDHEDALQVLLTPPPGQVAAPLKEDEMCAATVQFVRRRLAWSTNQVKPSKFAP